MDFPAGKLPDARPGPAGGKRAANRARKVGALCEATLALALEHGLEPVTIGQITERAGIAKGSFYRYFDSKAQLVEALFTPLRAAVLTAFDHATAEARAATEGAALTEVYQALALELGQLLLGHPDEVRLYLAERRGPDRGPRQPLCTLSREIGARSLTLTEAAHSHGLLRPIDPRISAYGVIGAVEELLHRFLGGEDIGDPAQGAEALVAMIMDGLRLPGDPSTSRSAGAEGR